MPVYSNDVTLVEFKKWSERVVWQIVTLTGHSDAVVSVTFSPVAFSPDGKQFVSRSRDSRVKIWDTETGAQVSKCGVEVSGFVTLCGVW